MGKIARVVDWVDLVLLLVVGTFGLFILLSIDHALFFQQLEILTLAIVIGLLVSLVDRSLLLWAAPVGYVASILFLILPYLGPSIRGATRWVVIGGAQLQPSELVKPLLLLAFAWAMKAFPPRTVKAFLIHAGFFAIPFFFVFRQPDVGTSIVYAVMWLSMMIAAGFPLRYVITGVLVVFLILPFGWRGLHEYQRARITTFLNPGVDPEGAGYNAIQATIAVGSGGLFGRGLGRGTQSHLRFLPEFHTDFIFATLAEELGFFGATMLLFSYGILLWRIIRPLIAGEVRSIPPFTYSIGVFSMMLVQIVINAGMNMGLVPITGITLPLVSYGGSSLLSLCVCYGVLWAIRQREERVLAPLQ